MLSFDFIKPILKGYFESKGLSKASMKRYFEYMNDFILFIRKGLKGDQIEDLRQIKKQDILAYQTFLYKSKNKEGKKRFSISTSHSALRIISKVFSYLIKQDYLLTNPFDGIDLKMSRVYKRRVILTQTEMIDLLSSIDRKTSRGGRDHALLELLYGTGIRLFEAVKLDVGDLDLNSGQIFVRQGKGRRDRILPLGNRMVEVILNYLTHIRPAFPKQVLSKEALFLTKHGNRLNSSIVAWILRKRIKSSPITRKEITPYSFRHSFATHLLEAGVPLKSVQKLLGHKSMDTTVIYTHLNLSNLQKTLCHFHPRENDLFEELNLNLNLIQNLPN